MECCTHTRILIQTTRLQTGELQMIFYLERTNEYYLKSESDMKDIASSLDKVKGKIITNLKRKKLL